jgi:tetratricopeptide (TPR) repeat protein
MSLKTGVRVSTLLLAAALLLQPGLGQMSSVVAPSGYLQGAVAFEDGSIPTEKVTIESVCDGRPRAETTIDKKGRFQFTLGRNNAEVMQDASRTAGNTQGAAASMDACSVRAVLEGYLSDQISLANRRFGDKPELGTIVLHKLSAAAAAVPKDAKQAFDKGADALKNRKTDDAIQNFKKAVNLYPNYAQAWSELGKAQFAAKQTDDAHQSFEAAIKADANYTPAYLGLASLEAGAQNWKALADVTDRLLKIAPVSSPQVYLYNTVANLRLQNAPAAEKSARAGQQVDIRHEAPKLWQMLGAILADRGEFTAAADQFRKYLEYAPTAADAATVKAQLAECEKLAAQPKQ